MVCYCHELVTSCEAKQQFKKRQAEVMSEWQDMQQKPIVNFCKFLQGRFDKVNSRRQMAKDETTKLTELEQAWEEQ